jgi:hypothetical protein
VKSECDRDIDGEPWWYTPFAVGRRTDDHHVIELDALAMHSQEPPTHLPGAAPFHCECLEKRLSDSE